MTQSASTLMALRKLIEQHPRVASVMVSSLIMDGRAVAQTSRGRRWLAALQESPRAVALRELWEALGLSGLAVRSMALRPCEVVAAVIAATAIPSGPVKGGQ